MGRSLQIQVSQIAASTTYADTIADVHTSGVAEAQANLQGDMNVLRTLMKDLLGSAAFYNLSARTMSDFDTDLTAAAASIGTLQSDVLDLQNSLTDAEADISTLKVDVAALQAAE
jgi:peptidoglycan hydrolase CwlO-like protein